MVRFISALVGAAALAANIAIAAPLASRDSYQSSSYQQPAQGSSYQQPSQGSYQPPQSQPESQQPPQPDQGSWQQSPPQPDQGSWQQSPPQPDQGSWQPPQYQPQYQPPPPPPVSIPNYGSGWSNWGNYNNCVQQCLNKFATPPSSWMPPPPPPPPASETGAEGTPKVHSVVVGPYKGSYRYVPMYVNANMGDTVRFYWKADEHTVSRSSSFAICNKTLDQPFTSGILNATGDPTTTPTFDVVVNDTNPIYFYCSVGQHCKKGMFGMINPPVAPTGSNVTLGEQMPGMLGANPDMMAAWNAINGTTYGTSAALWGLSLNMTAMPQEAAYEVMSNVMYTQSFYAANPGTLEAGLGATAIDNQTALNFPSDAMALIASAAPAASAEAPANAGADAPAVADPNAEPATAPNSNSAAALISSRSAVALVAAVAAVLAF